MSRSVPPASRTWRRVIRIEGTFDTPGSRCAAALVCALLGPAACGTSRVDAPPPVVESDESADTALVVPPSYVSAPIVFDLRPVLAELEETVPARIGSLEKDDRIRVGSSPSVWLAAQLERGPLQFAFRDSTITLTTVFRYRGRAWVRALLAEPSVSCGLDGDPPRMRVSIATTYSVTADWRIRTHSAVTRVEPLTETERDQCDVSFLNIDVTGKIVGAAKDALGKALVLGDRRLARVDLSKPVGGLWEVIQQPISIADGTLWLLIQPTEIALDRVIASDSTLTARLSLRASPRIASGERPVLEPLALPALGRSAGADTVVVQMEGRLRYAVANEILAQELHRKSVRVGWRTIRIDKVEAMNGGGGRLILAVDLVGRARGRVYVVGTPTYDPETDLITIPDLAFDVNSESYLDQGLGWLAEGPLLGRIRDNAKIPAARLLDMAVNLANDEIDRELTSGVRLSGRIRSARAMAVRATADGLVARAIGIGELKLDISRQDLLPDRIPDPVARLRSKAAN